MTPPSESSMTTLVRLALVETRKVFTTRGIRTFLIVIASLGAAIAVGAAIAGGAPEVNAAVVVTVLGLMFTIVMPVLGALIFTSDWQHREIVSMFLAEPRRGRVFAAKLAASLVVTMLLLLSSTVVAAGLSFGLSFSLRRPLVWTGLGEAAPQMLAGSVVGVLCGAALGAALRNAIGAISLSFIQTLVIDPLMGFLPEGVGPYLMSGSITEFLLGDGAFWPSLTAGLVWLATPLVIGFVRHCFGEVS